MIKVQNLFYKQGDFCLEIPDWEFPDKSITLLSGVSGSGKTTLLNVLSGLLDCPSLVWSFKGKNLAQNPAPQRGISYCFQDLRLFPLMTAKQNILFALKAKNISIKEKQNDFEELVEVLNLKNCLNLYIEQLSGGEKQRTALARALIAPYEILFLDEPFSYLDKGHKNRARDFIKSSFKKNSKSLLLISHEKEAMAQQEYELKKGNIHNIK